MSLKVEWRSVQGKPGTLCVMISGDHCMDPQVVCRQLGYLTDGMGKGVTIMS